jgi:hypothetical protein
MEPATLLNMPTEIKWNIMFLCDNFQDITSLAQTSPLFNNLWRANMASISEDFLANTASYPKEAQDLAEAHLEILKLKGLWSPNSRIDQTLKLSRQLVINRKIAGAVAKRFLALLRNLLPELRPTRTPGIWTQALVQRTYYRIWHLCLAEHVDLIGRKDLPSTPNLSMLSHADFLPTWALAANMYNYQSLQPHELCPTIGKLTHRLGSADIFAMKKGLAKIVLCEEIELHEFVTPQTYIVWNYDKMGPKTLYQHVLDVTLVLRGRWLYVEAFLNPTLRKLL